MDLRRLERWVTTALYVAGGIALVIILANRLSPSGTISHRLTASIADFLTELGDVSGGLLIVIILLMLGGNRIMVSIFEGVDRYREWRRKNEQIKAEAEAAGRAEGLKEGRKAGRAEGLEEGRAEGLEVGRTEGLEVGRTEERALLRVRLVELGLNPDDILPPEGPAAQPQ